MQAFSDCLWRGFSILMYCDLLTKMHVRTRYYTVICLICWKKIDFILPTPDSTYASFEWVQPTQVAVGYLVWTSTYVFAVKSEKQSFDEVPPSEHDLIFWQWSIPSPNVFGIRSAAQEKMLVVLHIRSLEKIRFLLDEWVFLPNGGNKNLKKSLG